MKKLIPALCLLLLLTACLAPLGCAESENYDTLADWNIKIHVPDGTTAVLNGNAYYIYPEKAGYLPYVMLNSYRYSSLELFLSDFVEYMAGQYSDIRLLSDPYAVSIGGKQGTELDFRYSVSGYAVSDRRVILYENARAYVFCAKEVPELEQSVGTLLEDVIADCELLGVSESGGSQQQEAPEAPAYLYCLDNGMPKYWLDLSGAMADDPVLHCYFRSSDPTFYESCFLLSLDTAENNDNVYEFKDVSDMRGFDVSNRFERLAFDGGSVSLLVKRDERTLAGGADDNILSGVYLFEPHSYLLPLGDAPYTAEELARWGQLYYFRETGFYPPKADAVANGDGSFTIHLYEIVEIDDCNAHTATSAWYTVGADGRGYNDISGEAVALCG